MTVQELNQMEVHSVAPLFNGTRYSLEILRVPTGWIYQYYRMEIVGEEAVRTSDGIGSTYKREKVLFSTVFVPSRIAKN